MGSIVPCPAAVVAGRHTRNLDLVERLPALVAIIALFGGLPGLVGLVPVGVAAWAEHRRGFYPLGRLNTWWTVLLGSVLGALSWAACLVWSAKGIPGDYPEWQVVVCVIVVITVATGLSWLSREPFSGPLAACWALASGFATAWVVPASTDETGLFGFGYLMLTVGGGAGMLLLGMMVGFARYIVAHRNPLAAPAT